MALVLTVVRIKLRPTAMNAEGPTRFYQIECCIYEWSDGTRRAPNWNEEHYKTTYRSHINTLSDLRDHSPHGEDLVQQIQSDLLDVAW